MKESFMFFGIINENKEKDHVPLCHATLNTCSKYLQTKILLRTAATTKSCSGKFTEIMQKHQFINFLHFPWAWRSSPSDHIIQWIISRRKFTDFIGCIHKTEAKVVNANIFMFLVTRGTFSFLIAVQSTKALQACANLITVWKFKN